jgi:hypothetical protein
LLELAASKLEIPPTYSLMHLSVSVLAVKSQLLGIHVASICEPPDENFQPAINMLIGQFLGMLSSSIEFPCVLLNTDVNILAQRICKSTCSMTDLTFVILNCHFLCQILTAARNW